MDARSPPQEGQKQNAGTRLKRAVSAHPYAAVAIAIAIIVALTAVVAWWLRARHFESTDDAIIDARVTQISAQVNGAIIEVPVTDNRRRGDRALAGISLATGQRVPWFQANSSRMRALTC